MGIDRTCYLVFGAEIEHEKVDYEKHLPMIEGHRDAPFQIVDDPMCGEYAVVGKILIGIDPDYDEDLHTVGPEDYPEDPGALLRSIQEHFPEVQELQTIMFVNSY